MNRSKNPVPRNWRRVDANLRLRLATAAVGLPLLIILIGWSPPWMFSGVFLVLTAGALHDFFAMAVPHAVAKQFIGTGIGFVLALIIVAFGESPSLQLLASAFVLFCVAGLWFRQRLARFAPSLLLFTGAFYVGYLVPFVILLFYRPDGRWWVGWLLIVIMAGERARYFTGRRFGKKKIAPGLCPRKTVEGAWGDFAGAVVVGLLGGIMLSGAVSWFEIFL